MIHHALLALRVHPAGERPARPGPDRLEPVLGALRNQQRVVGLHLVFVAAVDRDDAGSPQLPEEGLPAGGLVGRLVAADDHDVALVFGPVEQVDGSVGLQDKLHRVNS